MSPKIFVIGCGSAGQRYMSLLNSIYSPSDVVGVRRQFSSPLTRTPFLQDIRHNNFIALDDIQPCDTDYVIIANPSSLHSTTYSYIRTLTPSCRILIEKPVCSSVNELTHMSSLEDPNTFVSFQYRYHPLVHWFRVHIRQLVEDVDCFTFNIEHADNVKAWHPWEDFTQSYSVQMSLGGGCTQTLCHAQDLIHYFFPDSTIISYQNGNSIKKIYPCDDWFNALYLEQSNPLRLFTSYVSHRPHFAFSFTSERFHLDIDMLTPSFCCHGSSPCNLPVLSQIPKSPADFRLHLFKCLLLDFMSTHPSQSLPLASSVANEFLPYNKSDSFHYSCTSRKY